MTKLAPAMYELCKNEAVKKGPRVMRVDGRPRTVYCLDRQELSELFIKNGFSRKGVSWLNMVISFKEAWHAVGPKDSVILNPNETWSLAFIEELTDSQILDLKFTAENNQFPSLVAEA